MATVVDWTKSLDVARLHADPSGVQEASTTFQALLFPGMSTQTARLRYISLFAAARNYRMKLGSEVNVQLPLSEYFPRGAQRGSALHKLASDKTRKSFS